MNPGAGVAYRAAMSWFWGRPKRYLSRTEEDALVAAMERAEQGHRGEVRVHLERRCPGEDALARAGQLFEALEMRATSGDTGVLLYVAVEDRKAAVFAGAGVHGAARPGFWQEVVDAVAAGYRRGEAPQGLVEAVERIGGLLRTAVPGADASGNELPNVVSQS